MRDDRSVVEVNDDGRGVKRNIEGGAASSGEHCRCSGKGEVRLLKQGEWVREERREETVSEWWSCSSPRPQLQQHGDRARDDDDAIPSV